MPEPDSAATSSGRLSFEPPADAARVSSVSHLHLSSSDSKTLFLFEGTVSSYYLGKLAHGEVPEALVERRVPIVSWRSQRSSELVVAPLRALRVSDYSLLSERGLLGTFQVSESAPLLMRRWPPGGSSGGSQFAVYCASATPPSVSSVSFEPRGVSGAVWPGVDEQGALSERCLHVTTSAPLAPGELLVPAPQLGDVALDPALFLGATLAPASNLECTSQEIGFGLGCATIEDDRLIVRTPADPLLWLVHSERGAQLVVTRAGSSFTVRGLSPETRARVWGSTRDLSDASTPFELTVNTLPARGRLLLNEVLADALGPEPQSEWIELLNDGTLAVNLADYSLQDGSGRSALPAAELGPKEFALLVRQDFATNGSDVAPAPGARLIRMAALGKSGLSNAGERLALLDRSGLECSVLPARVGKPGQSLARRTPAAPDDDPQSFSLGTPTPGFANDAPPAAVGD